MDSIHQSLALFLFPVVSTAGHNVGDILGGIVLLRHVQHLHRHPRAVPTSPVQPSLLLQFNCPYFSSSTVPIPPVQPSLILQFEQSLLIIILNPIPFSSFIPAK